MSAVAEKTKIHFKEYYKSLKREHQQQIRDNFLLESGISFPTFYRKLRLGRFTKLEQRLLQKIIGASIDLSF